MKTKLTRLSVEQATYSGHAIPGSASGWLRCVLWDTEIPGFGLRIFPSGRKVFVLSYRADGRKRLATIGDARILRVRDAREMARRTLGGILHGTDPLAGRGKQEVAGVTVRELAERYLAEHAPKKKASSVLEDRRQLERSILPALGDKPVVDVDRQCIGQMHHGMRDTPTQANRTLALISKLFSLAERWGLRPQGSNPAREIERFRERKRERFLSASELARLGAVLSEVERRETELPQVVAAIRLLLLTGCRRGEILSLTWREVDFERSCLRLQDSKTGAKTVPLGAAALEILASLPRLEGNPFVIFGQREGRPLVNLTDPWERIRKQAQIEDVRLHDLRHTFASVGAGSGLGLPIVGALLGHADAKTTSRYAHLADDPLREAAQKISGELAALLGGTKPTDG